MNKFNQLQQWKKSLTKFMDDDFWVDFQEMMYENTPKINLYESGNELFCLVALPGLKDVSQIDVYAYKRVLEIKGLIHLRFPNFRLIQEELLHGRFERTIELPYPVRDDKVEATYQNGILYVHLHRLISASEEKKRVNIQHLE
ncbi:Hsp20/alpha crystallin family protein [Alkalihalobacillus sp. BA299]|uniref:Hsp20/alpha crystallin family protein n=1 Tax=Alkalihalobacillus sp. BA299 TaxID=2815938 RepID=UPI001ADB0C55|nr:Hsp20/alpha crystallin family protein [Alkalihalobacillus sp. BA299]